MDSCSTLANASWWIGSVSWPGGVADGSLRRASAVRSLYVYGAAGRGKSWLANVFYETVPIRQKARVHFHGFFDELHRSIHNHRDEGDAVERAIDDVTRGARLLFFDELHVHDSGTPAY